MTISLDASQHLIKAVTVFSSRKAEVVRTFTVDLADGQNELSITTLPSCIDADSARVTGLGDAVLFDVVCTVSDSHDTPSSPDADTLKALERRREVLEGEKTLRGRVADILVQYGRTMSAEYTTVDTANSFLDLLVQRSSSTLGEATQFDEQIAEVDKEIEKEKRRLQKEHRKAAARGRVSAVIMTKRARKMEITLTYMVSNASWSPSYDLRATTEDGKPPRTVSLHYRASIQQNTGEDWRDTAVSVSTAMPGTWSTIPALRTMKISPGTNMVFAGKQANQVKAFAQRNAQQVGQVRSFGAAQSNSTNTGAVPFNVAHQPAPGQPNSANVVASFPPGTSHVGTALFGSSNTNESVPFGAASHTTQSAHAVPPLLRGGQAGEGGDEWTAVEIQSVTDPEPSKVNEEDAAWGETKAVVTESAVASSFRIEEDCTIPSEPTAHRVAIALLSFDAKVNYIAVPRSAPVAFLQCEVKNTSQYRLLPGPVNVFLDNSPVSKTSINDVNPEEVFNCTLGPDPSLRIKCTRLPPTVTSSGSAYVAQTKITTYKLCTTVQNGHGFPVKGLQVRDAAPNSGQPSENAGIKVVIKRPEGLAEAASEAIVDVPKASVPNKCSVNVRWGHRGGEREGKYVWIVDVGPGEEVKLEAEYEVRAPADYLWHLREEIFH